MTTPNTNSLPHLALPPGDGREPQLADLNRLLERLPDPRNYLEGVTSTALPRPVRILLFRRRKLDGQQRSMHGRHVLILCLAGGGQVGIGPDIVDLQPGEAVLVLPFRLHYYARVPESLNWLYITFELAEPSDLAPLAARSTDFDGVDQTLMAEITGQFLAAVPKTTGAYGEGDTGTGEAGLAAALVLLLVRLLDHARLRDAEMAAAAAADAREQDAAESAAGSTGNPLDMPEAGKSRLGLPTETLAPEVQVMARINSDLAALPSLAGLAAAAGISESHLRDRFRERFGMSLGRYIRAARLEEASRLLAHTQLRVKEVAAQVGYDSPFAFSRAFADYTGHSPRAWRRQRA